MRDGKILRVADRDKIGIRWRGMSKRKTTAGVVGLGRLHIFDYKDVGILDDDIVHVNGVELGEVSGKRDEINGRALVELVQIGVTIVIPLPP